MPRIHETLQTSLSVEDAYTFIADFANTAQWDPGTLSSVRLDEGPVGVGARYRLQVRMGRRVAPMEYRIVTHEPTSRVVLEGAGSGVTARDEIRFAPLPTGGTAIDYVADIRLGGWMRLLEPFAGAAFRRIGRDAQQGMRGTLDARAATASVQPRP
jgi:hypothetical protein